MDAVEKTRIVVENVSKFFPSHSGRIQALKDVSFCAEEGEFVAILGPSGCGKSTLLNMIAGLESYDKGKINVNVENVNQPERHRMMMFQESALFPWYNVIQNVTYGLRFKQGLKRSDYTDVALYYLSLVGLKKYAYSRIYQLSGGMKQRVALARALAPNPQILLMDEPFSALDAVTCEQLYKDVQRIWQSQRKTILLVTHNIREAIVLAQRVVVLSPHPGRVMRELNIELSYPRNLHDTAVSDLTNQITAILNQKSL
ncbi:MAG: ABC transporter ATP-binding protein [bacterium]